MDEHTSHELAYHNGYAEGHEKGYKEGFLRGFDAGKQDAQKWIPVTERLTDAGIEVLAMLQVDKFNGHKSHNVTTAVVLPNGSWLVADYQEGIEAETAGTDCEDCHYWITHWMPLPEPPKGE